MKRYAFSSTHYGFGETKEEAIQYIIDDKRRLPLFDFREPIEVVELNEDCEPVKND